MNETLVYDAKGVLLAVGDRVDGDGVITKITEADADYDDNLGRAVQYGPYVHVQYADCDDQFICRYEYAGGPDDDGRYVCVDVVKVPS